jgi:hypothetical protein
VPEIVRSRTFCGGGVEMGKRRGFVFLLGALVGLTLLLGIVSSGRAGSVLPSNALTGAVEPQFLTSGESGVAFGKVTAPSGSGTGSATNVSITFDLDSDLLDQNSPTCVPATGAPAGFTRWTCSLGTINAGTSAGAFVNFTGPAPNVYEVRISASADGGKGKGGGGQTEINTITDTTEIVAAASGTRAGNCEGSASTADGDVQDTTLTGTAGSSVATCPWVFVGENPAPNNSGLKSQISFWGFPETDPDEPARWSMNLDLPPGPFSDLKVFYLESYSPAFPNQVSKTEFVACEDDGTPIPDGLTACLDNWVKVGSRGFADGFVVGTGGDPGAGVG